MNETCFVGFNLGGDRLDLTRAILRRAELLDAAELHDEASPLAGLCSIRLRSGDARLGRLEAELAAVGAEPSMRLERHYSSRELDQFEWLLLIVRTVGLTGHSNYRQPYSRESACTGCGLGALPVPPLSADLLKMGRKKLDVTADGHLVVTADLAVAMAKAGLTGVKCLAVRRPNRKDADPDYRWLFVSSEWPRMLPTSSVQEIEPCPNCRRSGYFVRPDRPHEIHYKAAPTSAEDFNQTWERFGYWSGPKGDASFLPFGGAPLLVVSQQARRVLNSAGARRLEFQPIVFAG